MLTNFIKQTKTLALIIGAVVFLLVLADRARGQGVIVDSTSSNGMFYSVPTAGQTLSWSHNNNGSGNRLLLVGISSYIEAPTTSARVLSVDYGGISLTRVGTQISGSSLSPLSQTSAVEIFELHGASLPTGVNTVTVTFSLPVSYAVGGSVSFSNVNQTNPFRTQTGGGAFAGSSAVSGAPTVAVNSATGELVFDTVSTNPTAGFLAENAPQTKRWDGRPFFSFAFDVGAGSTRSGASPSVTMSWNSLTSPFAIGAVSLMPSSGTAALLQLNGQVLKTGNRGLPNATVRMICDRDLTARITTTGKRGEFTFNDIEAGSLCFVTVNKKGYTFAPQNQAIQLNDEIKDIMFLGVREK